MTTIEDLERRLATVERDHATARELGLLRASVDNHTTRLGAIESKLDGLIEDVASFRAVQLEQSETLRNHGQMLAHHGEMLQILIDRG